MVDRKGYLSVVGDVDVVMGGDDVAREEEGGAVGGGYGSSHDSIVAFWLVVRRGINCVRCGAV